MLGPPGVAVVEERPSEARQKCTHEAPQTEGVVHGNGFVEASYRGAAARMPSSVWLGGMRNVGHRDVRRVLVDGCEQVVI